MKTQVINIASQYAITVKDLKIIFNEKTEEELIVLDNFNYQFKKNKIYFIVGNSGSGKTSLISHFNGLLKSKYGDLTIGNENILGSKRKIHHFKALRKTCGMVFQFPEYQLFKDTIEKDIIFGPINLGENKNKAKLKAKKYLNVMGLDDSFLQRSPFELSGGQKRRVAIAGILAIEPEILVFDEPTAGLDPAGEKEMLDIIQQANHDGKTIIIITHVMDQVLALGDEVLVLNDKKLEAAGTPYDVFTNKALLEKTTLDLPKVITVIEKLVQKDQRFEELYQIKPRNVDDLAKAIQTIITKSKYEQ
ncbi:MAG: ATP-binding cassette domain-containing protein [Mycoplasmataceae bacterium]|jgi:energy-coupling factor transport system ATP-binding protein|nr:ATP-binding cassette domain-containing protein [Mycoplasmataceae bacterium]